MSLDEQVRVVLVERGVRIGNREEGREAISPRKELSVEVQHGGIVRELDGKCVIRYSPHDLCQFVSKTELVGINHHPLKAHLTMT
jgi:hypothetical protein